MLRGVYPVTVPVNSTVGVPTMVTPTLLVLFWSPAVKLNGRLPSEDDRESSTLIVSVTTDAFQRRRDSSSNVASGAPDVLPRFSSLPEIWLT